jgi:hypothetical protein
MSFTHNPYRHMDIVTDEELVVFLRCDSCGAELYHRYTLDTPVRELRRRMDEHIRRDHNRAPSDFEGQD